MPNASSEPQPAQQTDASRLRQIGFIPLLAIFYGYTAGGPFGFENIYHDSGPGMALIFLTFVPFFWSIPISFASAELNSILPVQGGFYRWTRAAFGDFWGFQCGWWNWAGTFLLNSLYGVLVMDYLSIYIPSITGPTKWAGACAVLIILAALNARGIQVAGWLSVALLILVLIPVAWLCAVALFHVKFNPVVPFVPPGAPFGRVFGRGLALAMWNYAGYEQLSSSTAEMKDPQKTFVRVLLWNTPMNILTYIVPTTLALAVLGNWSEWKTDYIVTASRLIGGPALGAAMLIAAMIGTLSLSNSTILYTTRVPATMAEDGYLPEMARQDPPALRHTRPRNRRLLGCLLCAGEIRRRGPGEHLYMDQNRDHAADPFRGVANAPQRSKRAARVQNPRRKTGHGLRFNFSGNFVRAESRAK